MVQHSEFTDDTNLFLAYLARDEFAELANMTIFEFCEGVTCNKLRDKVKHRKKFQRFLIYKETFGEGNFPYENIFSYVKSGFDAQGRIPNLEILTKRSRDTLERELKSVLLNQNNSKSTLIVICNDLEEKYPDCFKIREISKSANYQTVSELIKVGRNLLSDEFKRHADICFKRSQGITLQEIGESLNPPLSRQRMQQIEKRYEKYTYSDSEKRARIVRELMKKVKHNRLPSNSEIEDIDPRAVEFLCTKFSTKSLTAKNRFQLAEEFGLHARIERPSNTKWSIGRLIYELREFARLIGKPGIMPQHNDFLKHKRQDLLGAIPKYGTLSFVARIADLEYQSQIAGDNSRTYWTDDKISSYLHEVANREGISGYLPTQKMVNTHARRDFKTTSLVGIFTRSAYAKYRTLRWDELAAKYGLKFDSKLHKHLRKPKSIDSSAPQPDFADTSTKTSRLGF